MSLFAELKRRKVIRVAVVCATTAVAVLQAADIMLPRVGVPDWGISLVIALILLGFPIALKLGWPAAQFVVALDMAARGERGHAPMSGLRSLDSMDTMDANPSSSGCQHG